MIAILGAMEEEITGLLALATDCQQETRGSRKYYRATLAGHKVVIALSRIGKVAAASTVTTLLDHYQARKVLFTGVAGGIAPHVKRGDVIIADRLLQHDFDAHKIMGLKRFEIPLLDRIYFSTDTILRQLATDAVQEYLTTHPDFNKATLYQGIIASGDQFIVDANVRDELITAIPGLLAVEMEGAAIAQVCYEWKIPFLVLRSVSDSADSSSPQDFNDFLKEIAAPLSAGVVLSILKRLPVLQ